MPTPKTSNLDSFRSTHVESVVVPNKIKVALATMLKEHPEAWRYEVDFLKLVGVSTTQLAGYRDAFEKHTVNVGTERSPKRVWFADPKVAAKAKG